MKQMPLIVLLLLFLSSTTFSLPVGGEETERLLSNFSYNSNFSSSSTTSIANATTPSEVISTSRINPIDSSVANSAVVAEAASLSVVNFKECKGLSKTIKLAVEREIAKAIAEEDAVYLTDLLKCPICLGQLGSSTMGVPQCGHVLHKTCFRLIKTKEQESGVYLGNKPCAICRSPILDSDIDPVFEFLAPDRAPFMKSVLALFEKKGWITETEGSFALEELNYCQSAHSPPTTSPPPPQSPLGTTAPPSCFSRIGSWMGSVITDLLFPCMPPSLSGFSDFDGNDDWITSPRIAPIRRGDPHRSFGGRPYMYKKKR